MKWQCVIGLINHKITFFGFVCQILEPVDARGVEPRWFGLIRPTMHLPRPRVSKFNKKTPQSLMMGSLSIISLPDFLEKSSFSYICRPTRVEN